MERCADLEQLVADWFRASSSADPSVIDAHVSLDADTRLIAGPGGWIQGGSEVAAYLRGELEAGGGRSTTTLTDTEAYRHGDVGWAATRITVALPDGRELHPRWSTVFVREDGTWKVVQMHASFARDAQAAS